MDKIIGIYSRTEYIIFNGILAPVLSLNRKFDGILQFLAPVLSLNRNLLQD